MQTDFDYVKGNGYLQMADGPITKGDRRTVPERCLLEAEIESSWLQESELEVPVWLKGNFSVPLEEVSSVSGL